MSKEKFREALRQELHKIVDGVEKPAARHLAKNVASPLAQAIEDSLEEAAQTKLDDLFGSLGDVDKDIQQLRKIGGHEEPMKPTYEAWARYWASVSPDLEVVKRLVRVVVLPKIREVRAEANRLRTLEDRRFVYGVDRHAYEPADESNRVEVGRQSGGKAHADGLWEYALRRSSSETLSPPATHFARRLWAIANVANLGTCPATLSASVTGRQALDRLTIHGTVYCQIQNRWAYRTLSSPLVNEMERLFAEQCQWIGPVSKVDAEASEHVPNASFKGFGRSFAEAATRLYVSALSSAAPGIRMTAEVRVRAGRRFVYDPTLPPAFIALASVFAGSMIFGWLSGGSSVVQWTSALTLAVLTYQILATVSQFAAKGRLRKSLHEQLPEAMKTLDERAVTITSNHIDEAFVDRVLSSISVELSPRPLQRALNESTR